MQTFSIKINTRGIHCVLHEGVKVVLVSLVTIQSSKLAVETLNLSHIDVHMLSSPLASWHKLAIDHHSCHHCGGGGSSSSIHCTPRPCFTCVCFTPFCFNTPYQFTLLLNLSFLIFSFNLFACSISICLFVTGMSLLIHAHILRNTARA